MKSSNVYSNHLKPITGKFCDIAHPYKLLTSQYLRYDDYLFLKSFIYLLLTFTYLITE